MEKSSLGLWQMWKESLKEIDLASNWFQEKILKEIPFRTREEEMKLEKVNLATEKHELRMPDVIWNKFPKI